MSDLVPEKRQDINGKLVTRYVRLGGPTPGAGRFPAPQNSVRDTAKDKLLVDLSDPKDKEAFAREVRNASPDVVNGLLRFFADHKEDITREIADHVIHLVSSRTKNIPRYVDLLNENFDHARSVHDEDAVALVNGIIDIEDRVIKGALDAEQRKALITVTNAVVNSPDCDPFEDMELRLRNDMYHSVMTDKELIRFVVDNADRAEEIAAVAATGVKRPGEIKAVLDDDIQRPLLDGAL